MKESSAKITCSEHEGYKGSMHYRLINEMDSSSDDDNNWLISLSDVLSLLLVFFIMFLVMTKGSGSVEDTQHVENKSHVLSVAGLNGTEFIAGERIRDEITSEINTLALGDDISVLATDREITVTIKEKVTFRPGEAEILASFQPVLDNLAETIQKHPSLHVDIIGHTDNVPINTYSYPSNWELSVARATNVLKYFITKHSLDPSRLSIKGNADQKPVAPNNTPENRAQNRRVEIRLKYREA